MDPCSFKGAFSLSFEFMLEKVFVLHSSAWDVATLLKGIRSLAVEKVEDLLKAQWQV